MVILVTQTLNYGKCGPDMGKPREEGAGGPGPLHPMIGRVGGGVRLNNMNQGIIVLFSSTIIRVVIVIWSQVWGQSSFIIFLWFLTEIFI